MFTDVSLRNDLNGKFAEYVNDCETDLGLTFSVMVLQVTTTLTAIVVVVVSVVVILLEQLIPPPSLVVCDILPVTVTLIVISFVSKGFPYKDQIEELVY